MEKKVISCEFNIDTACVEVKYVDGSMISIDCTKVETAVTRNMYEASELDWLVYNTPMDLCESAAPLRYPGISQKVTEYHLFDN